MNILLLVPPFVEGKDFYRPLDMAGVSITKSYLENNGNRVFIYSSHNERSDISGTIEEIKGIPFDLMVIFASYYKYQFFDEMFYNIKDMTNILRHLKPHIHISLVGTAATFLAKEFLSRCPHIDSLCMYEYEETLIELSKCLSNNIEWKSIEGICYFDKQSNSTVLNKNRKPANFDDTPYIDDWFINREFMTISSSKGCPGRCSFCISNEFDRGIWRGKDISALTDEIQYYARVFGVRRFAFSDINFLGYKKSYKDRVDKLYKEFRSKQISIKFKASARVDCIDEDSLKLLGDMGLCFLFLGVESGIPRVLKDFNKGISPEMSIDAVRKVYENHIMPQIGFIFFDPFMQFEEIDLNIDFLEAVSQYTFYSILSIEKLRILKGTALSSKVESLALFDEKNGYYNYEFIDKRVSTYEDILNNIFNSIRLIDMKLRVELDELYWKLHENNQYKASLAKQLYDLARIQMNRLTTEILRRIKQHVESGCREYKDLVDLYIHEAGKITFLVSLANSKLALTQGSTPQNTVM